MAQEMTTTVCALALTLVVLFNARRRYRKKVASNPLPPGPPGLPFFGNVTGIDKDAPWLTYAEWAKTYGDLIHTRLFGKDIIVINSEAIAKDLLETRSRNYSDRPYLATKAPCGMDSSSVFMEYGDRWRLHRRFFHQTFRSDATPRFLPIQHRKVCQLLMRLMNSPDQVSDHVFEYTAAVIMNSVYDYDPASKEDELVDIVGKTLDITLNAVRPDTAILVGAFPALLKLPSWFPGMSFKKRMAIAKEYSELYIREPFEYSTRKLNEGGSTAPSMVFDAFRNMEEKGVKGDEKWLEELAGAAATGFIAAAETSNSVIMSVILAMTLNPDVQAKAHAQINAVVGNKRLPSIEDRPSLPYLDAIIRETLRYSPVAPLAIPHAVVEDDVYAGYHIPKGATVLPNLWAMGHNPSKYPNPYQFLPERFLNPDGSLTSDDVEHIAYGFGRRICVGRYFADTSVWSVIVKVLAVFKIEKAKDKNGVGIPVEEKFSSGIAIHPLPFRCRIAPRMEGVDVEGLERLIGASIV